MKGRVKYFVLAIFFVVLGFIGYTSIANNNKIEYIAKGEEKIQLSEDWLEIISDSVNEKGIKLYLDGKLIEFKNSDIYMDKQMNIMIPSDDIIDTFDCTVNIYGGLKILVEKASKEMVMNLSSSVITVDGMNFNISGMPTVKNEKIYIPIEARLLLGTSGFS